MSLCATKLPGRPGPKAEQRTAALGLKQADLAAISLSFLLSASDMQDFNWEL